MKQGAGLARFCREPIVARGSRLLDLAAAAILARIKGAGYKIVGVQKEIAPRGKAGARRTQEGPGFGAGSVVTPLHVRLCREHIKGKGKPGMCEGHAWALSSKLAQNNIHGHLVYYDWIYVASVPVGGKDKGEHVFVMYQPNEAEEYIVDNGHEDPIRVPRNAPLIQLVYAMGYDHPAPVEVYLKDNLAAVRWHVSNKYRGKSRYSNTCTGKHAKKMVYNLPSASAKPVLPTSWQQTAEVKRVATLLPIFDSFLYGSVRLWKLFFEGHKFTEGRIRFSSPV